MTSLKKKQPLLAGFRLFLMYGDVDPTFYLIPDFQSNINEFRPIIVCINLNSGYYSLIFCGRCILCHINAVVDVELGFENYSTVYLQGCRD